MLMDFFRRITAAILRRIFGKGGGIDLSATNPDSIRHTVVGGSEIEVGRFTYGLDLAIIREWGEGAPLRIGSFCSLAQGVTIFLGGNHRADWITTYPFGHIFQEQLNTEAPKGHPYTNGPVVIGNCVWIGTNASIMSGVTIADGAIVAANSTVTKDVGPYEIVGGNPAKLIRKRFDDETIQKLVELAWWSLDTVEINKIVSLLCGPPNSEKLDSLIAKYRPQK
jgi:acetyltransferase-like isoleucine patch superfamily enzyme